MPLIAALDCFVAFVSVVESLPNAMEFFLLAIVLVPIAIALSADAFASLPIAILATPVENVPLLP